MGRHRPADHETSISKHSSVVTTSYKSRTPLCAQVPPQPNYCDCGVYLLHFVEQFMSDPETFSQQILVSFCNFLLIVVVCSLIRLCLAAAEVQKIARVQ